MAIISGTATTFAGSPGMQGMREDLSDMIYMLSPSDTPFTSNVGRGTADAVLHEWQTDSLAAPNTANAQFQGDDIATFTPASVTARLGNRTQISRKEVIISGTLDAVNKAGRRTELAYQMTKRAKELKIDIEAILLSNQAKVTGAAATAPKLPQYYPGSRPIPITLAPILPATAPMPGSMAPPGPYRGDVERGHEIGL